MTVENSKKIEQGKKTNANLVKIARRLFSQKGYANTSTEEIVQVAGVTRGALYHHFNGKKGLFLAAFDDAQIDIENSLIKVLNKPGDPWERFLTANYTFLKACMHPEIQQIVAIDAPAILGWHEWRRIDAIRTTRLLKNVLLDLINKGIIKPLPIEALVHFIGGAANELAIWIAQSKEPKKALEEASLTMKTVLSSSLIRD